MPRSSDRSNSTTWAGAPLAPAMFNSERHFHGEPCAKCRSTVRYKASRNCVECAKAAVRKRRGQLLVVADDPLPEYDDLLGDINAYTADVV